MKCPYCEGESQVIDSRQTADGVRRRRVCPECKRRFTTYERLGSPGVKVSKRSGKTEPFTADKIVALLSRVCRDRPNVSDGDVKRIARSIEAALLDSRQKTVESNLVLEMILEKLIELDKLSYDRLAVNYLSETGQLRTRPSKTTDDSDQLGLFGAGDDNDV